MFLLVTLVAMASARSAFAQTEVVTVNIPPQELSTALAALAEQTNLQVLYASELTGSQMTKGIAGTFTPQEAIRQLLEGTGLASTFTDAKTVTLQKAPVPAATSQSEPVGSSEPPVKQKPIKLPEVLVKDVRERDDANTYVAEAASTATRTNTPLIQVPQSVGVVTRQVMDDQKAIRVEQALRNVSGMALGDVGQSGIATYDFQAVPLQGFGVGGAIFAAGERAGDLANTFELPGYVRTDAALYYRKQEIFPNTNLIAQLNAQNLLGQEYFYSGGQGRASAAFPGAPLTFLGSLKLEFH